MKHQVQSEYIYLKFFQINIFRSKIRTIQVPWLKKMTIKLLKLRMKKVKIVKTTLTTASLTTNLTTWWTKKLKKPMILLGKIHTRNELSSLKTHSKRVKFPWKPTRNECIFFSSELHERPLNIGSAAAIMYLQSRGQLGYLIFPLVSSVFFIFSTRFECVLSGIDQFNQTAANVASQPISQLHFKP